MVVDEGWHDGDGAGTRAFVKDLGNVLVLDTDHVLSVHLTEEVVNEEAIAGGRGGGGRGRGREKVKHIYFTAKFQQPMFSSEAKTTVVSSSTMYFTNYDIISIMLVT